ncbi:hypothetical protein IWZ00DRAFT_252906 [Phyllosticta capitalensis]
MDPEGEESQRRPDPIYMAGQSEKHAKPRPSRHPLWHWQASHPPPRDPHQFLWRNSMPVLGVERDGSAGAEAVGEARRQGRANCQAVPSQAGPGQGCVLRYAEAQTGVRFLGVGRSSFLSWPLSFLALLCWILWGMKCAHHGSVFSSLDAGNNRLVGGVVAGTYSAGGKPCLDWDALLKHRFGPLWLVGLCAARAGSIGRGTA